MTNKSLFRRKSITHKTKHFITKSLALTAVAVIGFSASAPASVLAVDYEARLRELRQKNAATAAEQKAKMEALRQENQQSESARNTLQSAAETLEQRIARLQASIKSLEQGIADNHAKAGELKAAIGQTEQEITNQRIILASNIRRLYLESQMTTTEQLATSKNLSAYVDKEQYRISLQRQVNETLDRIQNLKLQQEADRLEVETLINSQQIMRLQSDADKRELDKLLSLNKEEQSRYNQAITENTGQIQDLQRQQAQENERFLREQTVLSKAAASQAEARRQAEEAARKAAAEAEAARRAEAARQAEAKRARIAAQAAGAPAPAPAPTPKPAAPARPVAKYVDGRAYPWAGVPFPNSMPDPWGMYKRQCVSYTAWKVSASGRHMPYWGGRGNAKNWDDNARAAGIPVDRNPRVGDVGVRNTGTYGHVVYVEAVHDDGTISISQYNASWTGTYSEARIYPGDLVFIHF